MAAINSNGTGGGNWSSGSSWAGGVAPGEGDTCTILSGDTIVIDGNITVGADTSTPAIKVNSGGTLSWPHTVAGDYTLTAKGDINISGTFSIGSVANPIPANRTVTIRLNYSASPSDGKYGLIISSGGSFVCQAAPDRIAVDRALLAANNGGTCNTSATGNRVTRLEGTPFTGKSGTVTINGVDYTIATIESADSLTLTASPGNQSLVSFVFQSDNTAISSDVSTGWKSGDLIGIASTDRSWSHCEKFRLNGDASGTSITLNGGEASNGGLKWGHMGTSPIQAELINLTRNIVITAYNTTYVAYVYFVGSATGDLDWTEFCYLGESATGKRGVEIGTTNGNVSLNNCSIHDTEDYAIYLQGNLLASGTVAISNVVVYGVASQQGVELSSINTGATASMSDCIVMRTAGGGGVLHNDPELSVSNLVVAGANSYGYKITNAYGAGNISNITCHSCTGAWNEGGITLNGGAGGTSLANLTAWRNNSYGIMVGAVPGSTLTDVVVFGNNGTNILLGVAAYSCPFCEIINLTTNGDSVFATTTGVSTHQGCNAKIISGDFSTVSSIKTAHTNDIACNVYFMRLDLVNCKLGGTNEVASQSSMARTDCYVSSARHNQTAGLHKTWKKYGTITIDTSIYDVSPSVRATPISASGKLECPVARVPVPSGGTATVSVKVRKSVAGDGAAYNGNQPRLIWKANVAAGVASDTVMATASGGAGTWETLTGTTPTVNDNAVLEIVVDCDGTAGWINIDTAARS